MGFLIRRRVRGWKLLREQKTIRNEPLILEAVTKQEGEQQRRCWKSTAYCTSFFPSVPRFKSHWKVRNKAAPSTAMTACPGATARVGFVIPAQDTALMYLCYQTPLCPSWWKCRTFIVICDPEYLSTQFWSILPYPDEPSPTAQVLPSSCSFSTTFTVEMRSCIDYGGC